MHEKVPKWQISLQCTKFFKSKNNHGNFLTPVNSKCPEESNNYKRTLLGLKFRIYSRVSINKNYFIIDQSTWLVDTPYIFWGVDEYAGSNMVESPGIRLLWRLFQTSGLTSSFPRIFSNF